MPPAADVAIAERSEASRFGLSAALSNAGLRVECIPHDLLCEWVQPPGTPDAVALVGFDDDGDFAYVRAVAAGSGRPVVFAPTAEITFVAEALRAGAYGVVARSHPVAHVVEVVNAARIGSCVLGIDHARSLARIWPSRGCCCQSLESEELNMLRGLAEGTTVRALARRLHRSERDCYRLFKRLRTKLGASSRAEVVVHAARCGLLAGDVK